METTRNACENHTEKVKCIKLDDLISLLNSLETKEKEYDKLVKYGLPVTVNKNVCNQNKIHYLYLIYISSCYVLEMEK